MCIHEYFLKTITKIVPLYKNIIELIGIPLLCRKYAVLMSTLNVNMKINIMIRLSINLVILQMLGVSKTQRCKHSTLQILNGATTCHGQALLSVDQIVCPFSSAFLLCVCVCVDVSVYLTIMYLVQRQSEYV